ncbi:hypothetical protein GCM10009001_09030 [Virgibacillus siamensis]|uniref:VOC domain-containing protein n=1 Tax=Virgibacillus siamensis TaxID=480071 RepID=A0ABP3QV92_9BACI
MSLFERIDTICFTVSDIEKSAIWYEEVLGFKVAYKGDTYRIYSIGQSEMPLTIEKSTEKKAPQQDAVYPIFFTKNIQDTFHQLKEQNVEVSEIKHDGQNTFFNFYDPDYNKLQVCYWE